MKQAIRISKKTMLLAVGGAMALAWPEAYAEEPIKLYDFEKTAPAGDNPYTDLLAASDGNLYGSDYYYDPYFSNNPIFRLTPQGAISVIANEYINYCNGSSCTTGPAVPGPLMQGSDSNFYGTAYNGGSFGGDDLGAVIQMTPAGQITNLHYFAGTDGKYPKGALVQGGTNGTGAYFGTTSAGDTYQNGNIFRINSSGSFSIMHTFGVLDGSGQNSDGAVPMAGMVVGSDLNFYGTTSKGGAHGYGTVYQLTPQGLLTTLHSFSASSDGANPMGPLVLANDGNFYGTTVNGGANGQGTIFRIAPDGTFQRIHSFTITDGMNPLSRLVEVDSGTTQILYGTTTAGGAYGEGTIYSITTTGTFKSLYSFNTVPYGAEPNGLTVGEDGNLYGTTKAGGFNGVGIAFEWALQKPVVTIKVSPKKVAPGAAVTLTWSSTGASSCTGSGAWSGPEALAGTQPLTAGVKGSYVYTLNCTGPHGSASQSATLTVS